MPSFFIPKTTTTSISTQAAYDAALEAQELANKNYQKALVKYEKKHAKFKSNNDKLTASYNKYADYSEKFHKGVLAYNELHQESEGIVYRITDSKYQVPFNAPVKNFNFMEYFRLIANNPDLRKNGKKLQEKKESISNFTTIIFNSDSKITQLIEKNKILKEALDEQQATLEKAKADLYLADANLAAAEAALDNENSGQEADVFSAVENQEPPSVNDEDPATQEQAIITGQTPVDKLYLSE